MRGLAAILLVIILAVCGWRVVSIISPDATAMAIGMLFGVLSGIPTALLLLAAGRRSGDYEDDRPATPRTIIYIQPPDGSTTIIGSELVASQAAPVDDDWLDDDDWTKAPPPISRYTSTPALPERLQTRKDGRHA
jgi:hypothetical protein